MSFIYDFKHNKHEDFCERDSNTVTGYNYNAVSEMKVFQWK